MKVLLAAVRFVVAVPVCCLPWELARRFSGALPVVGASYVSGIVTLLAGFVVGLTGFLGLGEEVAARNVDLMLQVAAQQAAGDAGGAPVTSAAPVGMTMLTPLAFVIGTPLGWLSTYLVLSGLGRAISATIDEPAGDPILALAWHGAVGLRRHRDAKREAAQRARLEGPEVSDRLIAPERAGLAGCDAVVVASRRKGDWTPGTILDCGERWYRVGPSVEKDLPVGLRTLYPLTEVREVEVFRRVVAYRLPRRVEKTQSVAENADSP